VFYYVMELLRGLTLHDLIDRFGPLAEGRVIHILTQVCDSLAEAHALGLVHRDIKPANVYLCERGGVPDCVKVLDFGLVRLYRNDNGDPMHVTAEKEMVGTPWFMPPEAIKNSALSDPRSDIYAVGALGYYLLTGECVFSGETALEVYEKQLTQCPMPPSRRTTSPVSVELEKTILRCLDKDPAARPQSVIELRALLLTSPGATEWGLDTRTAWWDRFHNQPLRMPVQPAELSPRMATVKIDAASRAR